VNDELEGSGRRAVIAYIKAPSGICLQELGFLDQM
jgi:hypothetical protein